jgi:hypothetical protein
MHCSNYLKNKVKILLHQKQRVIKKYRKKKNRKKEKESLKYLQVIASYPNTSSCINFLVFYFQTCRWSLTTMFEPYLSLGLA